jgi:hypothetical protein
MKIGLSIKNKASFQQRSNLVVFIGENQRNIEKLASENIQQYCGFNLLNEHFEIKPP